ncbi:MAG: SGNH/GDSL hydrolase family protein [Terrimonas sp.]|nr:SGNH/GDSL hydrolase family protein [Terrimonas sp.]
MNQFTGLAVYIKMNRIILFLSFLVLAACTKPVSNSATIVTPPAGSPTKTWLALGDSYTIGQSVSASERFPAQTSNWLKLNGINIQEPDYIATTGWTTNNLQDAINTANPAPHDVVSLLIGVNDQYQRHDTTGYRQRFTALLAKAIQLAHGKKENVFVLSIPDYSVTPFAAYGDTAQIRREIDWFNAINKEVTLSVPCPYLDITPSTREARYNPSLVAGDGLHPSGLEYRRWTEKLGPLMLPVLQ